MNLVCVDDQPINIEVMKSQLASISMKMQPEYFFRGDFALEHMFKVLQAEVTMFKNSKSLIYRRPVDLLLCDF